MFTKKLGKDMTKKQLSDSINNNILTYNKLTNWKKYFSFPVIILFFLFLYLLSFGIQSFLQQFVNGIHVGSIYALIAFGYTMVYGIVKLINFAHGDLLMMVPYISYFLGNYFIAHNFHYPFIIVLILSMTFTALLGMIHRKNCL